MNWSMKLVMPSSEQSAVQGVRQGTVFSVGQSPAAECFQRDWIPKIGYK